MTTFVPQKTQEFSSQDGRLKLGRLSSAGFFFDDDQNDLIRRFCQLSSQLKAIEGIRVFHVNNLEHSVRLDASVLNDPSVISGIMMTIKNNLSSDDISFAIRSAIENLTGHTILNNESQNDLFTKSWSMP